MAWWCEEFHALPDSGGMYEQDFNLLHLMNVGMNVHRAYSKYRNAIGKQIHALTDSERRLLRVLEDEELF